MFSTPKKRLEFFTFVVYEGKKSLLQKAIEGVLNVKYTRQNFYNQISTEVVNTTLLNGLHKLGLNINWYLDGSGLMFNDNDVGKALKNYLRKVRN